MRLDKYRVGSRPFTENPLGNYRESGIFRLGGPTHVAHRSTRVVNMRRTYRLLRTLFLRDLSVKKPPWPRARSGSPAGDGFRCLHVPCPVSRTSTTVWAIWSAMNSSCCWRRVSANPGDCRPMRWHGRLIAWAYMHRHCSKVATWWLHGEKLGKAWTKKATSNSGLSP